MSSPALTRHLSGSLQRSVSRIGGQADPAPDTKLLACIHGPSAYPDRGTLLCAWLATKRPNGLCRAVRKSRLQGLATLLAASAPRPTEACFSFPRSWASLYKALVRSRDRFPVSRKPSAPALSCQTVRPDTGASAVYVRDISGTHRLSHPFRVKAGTLPS
jgi:hypothetical protein